MRYLGNIGCILIQCFVEIEKHLLFAGDVQVLLAQRMSQIDYFQQITLVGAFHRVFGFFLGIGPEHKVSLIYYNVFTYL